MSFIAGLNKIFNSGMVVGEAESAIFVRKFEYADDAALLDENDVLASSRLMALATGSMMDTAMVISIKKGKALHVHRPMRVDAATEADVATLGLSHKCDESSPSSEDSESTWLDGATAVYPTFTTWFADRQGCEK